MLLKLAWKNIWRNKIRSVVILTAIAFGLWGGLSAMGIMKGLNDQRVANFLNTQTAHIQIHDSAYAAERDVSKTLSNTGKHIQSIRQQPNVEGAASRVVLKGMAASSLNNSGVEIKGINPDHESHVNTIHQNLTKGNYFQKNLRNPVVIGKALAEKLGVKMKSKLILKFQNIRGRMTSAAFTVAGIFKTSDSDFDESTVFIDIKDARHLIGSQKAVHEIAIMLKNRKQISEMVKSLSQMVPDDYLVRSWKDIRPGMAYVNDFSSQMLYFIIGIILLALAFGIVNTMLMAVMERTRELGMLMAVGLDKAKVFRMIVMETVFLSIQGAFIGIIFGWSTIQYFGYTGINLSQFASGLSSFGFGDQVHPSLDPGQYPLIAGLVLITALIAAIYPAIKALSLKPATAIRQV